MESNGHPDLVHIGRVLRERMDRTLDAEMEAARAAARRSRTTRDMLLAAEDRGDRVHLLSDDGSTHVGTITAVGADHLEITRDGTARIVVLSHLVSVEVDR
ncbi:MAG TPA: hypothetical protein VJP05_03305 [Acidimicrobiia bacterium]|nr:hypothetical protein [Acidimicrobiia bacterium]